MLPPELEDELDDDELELLLELEEELEDDELELLLELEEEVSSSSPEETNLTNSSTLALVVLFGSVKSAIE